MASDTRTSASRRRDQGFTLIEMLVVITIMGTLIVAISSVIIVALRTTPSAEARVDDARGVQGLVTWLPQDIDAAPPNGFNRSPSDWPCAGPAPGNSYNVLSIRWTESAAASTNYAASYRYENSGTSWTMARYYCAGTGPASRNNLTSDLRTPWNPDPLADPLAQPAFTLMCSSVVDDSYDGNCPVANRHPVSELAPTPVLSLKLLLDLGDGNEIMIDAAPKNPDQTLADDPDATLNQPPATANTVIGLELAPDETKTFDLAPHFGAVGDPDGDATALTVSVDPTELLPDNLVSATTAYTATTQFELTLTANATSGTAATPLWLIVSDERGGWTVVQAFITVSDPPNVGPTAPSGDHLTIGLPANAAAINTIDIATLFDVQDDAPRSELRATVTSAVPGIPPADSAEFSVMAVSGTANIEVSFGPNIELSVGTFIEVYLDVTDAEFATLPLQLTIEILPAHTNTDPTAITSDVPISLEAGTSTTHDVIAAHGITDADAGDVLTTVVQSTPTGITATVSGNVVTIAAGASAPAGPLPTPVTIRVSDLQGAFVDVTLSITITVTEPPPPVSDCVLGSLSAAPNPVSRQGGGGGAKKLSQDVTVTVTYSGTCDGLRLNYDSGDPSGLGFGVGRVFPPGSPSSIVIVGHHNGGTEEFSPGSHVLTASTSSAVIPNSIATTLAVT